MAFCTKCGASVSGTFCSQCGTPAAASAQATPPPATSGPYAQPVPYGVSPATRKTSPIVWVLVIVLGIFVLGGAAVVGVIGFVAHRAHQAGLAFDRGNNGSFSIRARDANGKDASVEFGNTIGKLPSWVPVYPGSSNAQGTFAVKAADGEGGNFTFTTTDNPSRVKEFYAEKCKDLGMKVNLESTSAEGGMFVAADENGEKRSLTVVVGSSSGRTTVNVTYGTK